MFWGKSSWVVVRGTAEMKNAPVPSGRGLIRRCVHERDSPPLPDWTGHPAGSGDLPLAAVGISAHTRTDLGHALDHATLA